MCRSPALGLTLALALGLVVGCAAPGGLRPADDRAIRDLLEAQRLAWNRADLEGFMAGYVRSDDLVFTSGGKIRRGYQEIFDRYRARYGKDSAGMGQLGFEILGIQPLGGDGAVVLGRWRLTNTPNAAAGVFSVALVRTGVGWRVVHDHTSVDAP